MNKVTLKNVYKNYGKVEAVKDLSFNCKEGEFLSLLGPSGCGKSSTLRMIAGLEEITRGEIYINDKLVNNVKPGQRNIALAFENYALYPPLTIYENIAFPLQASGMESSKIKKRVNEIAKMLNLLEVLKRKPSKLSGGQQQLTSLARALVKSADVYLLDEPISHMDIDLRNRMRGELRRIHKEMGATFIYVTHDQLEAISMSDRIAIMDFGVLQQIGTAYEIYNSPSNLFVAGFIGEPPMNLIDTTLIRKNGRLFCKVDGYHISLSKEIEMKIKDSIQNAYVLGIRPSDIKVIKTKKEDYNIPAEVYIYEDLGVRVILTVRFGDQTVLIEAPPDFRAEMGDRIWLGYDQNKINIFNKKTGNLVM